MKLEVRGGKLYDPANQRNGVARSLFVEDGAVLDPAPAGWKPERVIDATGCVVMPGGVDVHCHIAGPSVNRARGLVGGDLAPSTFVTGYRYSALGYTTAVDAAVSPSGARQCHLEFEDTPNIERGFLLAIADHPLVVDAVRGRDRSALREILAWLLARTGALGLKAVNPLGTRRWRRGGADVSSVEEEVEPGLSPRAVIETLADVAAALRLPHPLHVHCNRLGVPGNVETTIATLRALEGRRAHLAHLQFHAYGKTDSGELSSGAVPLLDALSRCPGVTADVGQVVFGPALTLSADGPLEHLLYRLTGSRYVNIESECEGGCGFVPLEYRPRSLVHAFQWALGMELMLLNPDPWRLALSTDHPNGGSFLSYPRIIACLMSRARRDEEAERANPKAIDRTALGARSERITREYSLDEIAILTRAAPARMLGLSKKGHLGAGADADITIYTDDADRERMFASPRWVLQAGQVVIEDGELRAPTPGRTLRAAVEADPGGERRFATWFARHGSYHVSQFGLDRTALDSMRAVER